MEESVRGVLLRLFSRCRVVSNRPLLDNIKCDCLNAGTMSDMNYKTGRLVCGGELAYTESTKSAACFYCGEMQQTNAPCLDGHFVCDACHSASANDLIERFCIHTSSGTG